MNSITESCLWPQPDSAPSVLSHTYPGRQILLGLREVKPVWYLRSDSWNPSVQAKPGNNGCAPSCRGTDGYDLEPTTEISSAVIGANSKAEEQGWQNEGGAVLLGASDPPSFPRVLRDPNEGALCKLLLSVVLQLPPLKTGDNGGPLLTKYLVHPLISAAQLSCPVLGWRCCVLKSSWKLVLSFLVLLLGMCTCSYGCRYGHVCVHVHIGAHVCEGQKTASSIVP